MSIRGIWRNLTHLFRSLVALQIKTNVDLVGGRFAIHKRVEFLGLGHEHRTGEPGEELYRDAKFGSAFEGYKKKKKKSLPPKKNFNFLFSSNDGPKIIPSNQ